VPIAISQLRRLWEIAKLAPLPKGRPRQDPPYKLLKRAKQAKPEHEAVFEKGRARYKELRAEGNPPKTAMHKAEELVAKELGWSTETARRRGRLSGKTRRKKPRS
jgi:hypothetical protein